MHHQSTHLINSLLIIELLYWFLDCPIKIRSASALVSNNIYKQVSQWSFYKMNLFRWNLKIYIINFSKLPATFLEGEETIAKPLRMEWKCRYFKIYNQMLQLNFLILTCLTNFMKKKSTMYKFITHIFQ